MSKRRPTDEGDLLKGHIWCSIVKCRRRLQACFQYAALTLWVRSRMKLHTVASPVAGVSILLYSLVGLFFFHLLQAQEICSWKLNLIPKPSFPPKAPDRHCSNNGIYSESSYKLKRIFKGNKRLFQIILVRKINFDVPIHKSEKLQTED